MRAKEASLQKGWNAVAFPFARATAVAANPAVAGVASFSRGGYQTADWGLTALNAGQATRRGFFVYAQQNAVLNVTGEDDGRGPRLELEAGWNLVSFAQEAPVERASIRGENLLPTFYTTDGQTVTGAQLATDRPYWLYASAPTTLTWSRESASTLQLTPADASISVYAYQSYQVQARRPDGTTEDVTSRSTLTTSDNSVAAPTEAGQVRGLNPGSVTVTATYAGQSTTATLRVTGGGGGGGGFTPVPPPRPSPQSARALTPANGWENVTPVDMNGDGLPDLVAAARNRTGVGVALNLGSGRWADSAYYPTPGRNPFSLAVGDCNGDNRPDVVVGDQTVAECQLLLNQGDGTLGAPQPYSTATRVISVALADVNGDGNLDLLAGTLGGLEVRLGTGAGTFAAALPPLGSNVFALAAADFNGDGKMDVLAGGNGNTVTVCLGNGDGTFALQTPMAVAANFLTLADLDGDGRVDALADNGTLTALLSNGDGTFRSAWFYGDSNYFRPCVADFTGDGIPDVVSNLFLNTDLVALFPGQGDGTFGARQLFWPGASARLSGTAAADFDLDGRADLACAYITGFTVFTQPLRDPYVFQSVTGTSLSPAGDLNGDGKLDLLVSGGANGRTAYLGDGNGNLTAVPSAPVAVESRHLLADLNRDGRLDSLGLRGSGVVVALGQGDGTFAPGTTYNFSASGFPGMGVADFNGDGWLDVVVGHRYRLGQPGGTLGAVVAPPYTEPSSLYTYLATGDVNGDGYADVINSEQQYPGAPGDSAHYLRLGGPTGLGNRTLVASLPVSYTSGGTLLRDVTDDGLLDIVTVHEGEPCILPGTGTGTTFGSPVGLGGVEGGSLALADVNGDGRPDLVTSNTVIYLGRPGGFSPGRPFLSPAGGPICGDFYGDGRADLVSLSGSRLLVLSRFDF